jgi:hypothetical protein
MTTQRDYFFSLQHSWLFLNNLLNYYCYNIDLLYTQQIYTVLREVMGSLSGTFTPEVGGGSWTHASLTPVWGRGGGRLVIIMSTILTTWPRTQAPLLTELVLTLWCFSPLSFISWRSILLVEESGVFGVNKLSSTHRHERDFIYAHTYTSIYIRIKACSRLDSWILRGSWF